MMLRARTLSSRSALHGGALALLLLAGGLATTLGAQAATPVAASTAASAPSAKQLAALCDTCAIVQSTRVEKRKGKATAVGTAGGAVVGGVVGNKVGDGGVLATGVGAVAGAALGREIEKQAKRHKVWITTVTTKDGRTQSFEALSDPAFQAGDVARIENGALVKAVATLK
jgi:outer membrane lipoprotein SlyB